MNGRLFEFAEGLSETDTGTIDLEKLKQVGNALMENWKWAWTTEAMEDRDLAVKSFEQKLGPTAPVQYQESDMKGSLKYRAGLGHGQQTAVSL